MDLRTHHGRNDLCMACGHMGAASTLRRWGSDQPEPRWRGERGGRIHAAREATA